MFIHKIKLKKLVISLILAFFLLSNSSCVFADNSRTEKAQILKILEEKNYNRDNGQIIKQQNLELGILTGELSGKKVIYQGIGDLDVTTQTTYQVEDKVIVNYSKDETGKNIFFITDYIRQPSLIWLTIIFIVIAIIIGGTKGFKSLISLIISFFAIIKILVPLTLAGYNPLLIGLGVSLIILASLIYLTEGWNRKSHLSIISILGTLIITIIISIIFVNLTRLSGISQEEATFLIETSKKIIDFKGLLLAAIIIGALGVLDDVAIGQVEAVSQIKLANPNLSNKKVFTMAMSVGRAHLSAITNTLFLAYASTALPLLLLISFHQEPFVSWSAIVNNEEIATEIVRTLTSMIGLCLAVPLATLLAVKFLNNKQLK